MLIGVDWHDTILDVLTDIYPIVFSLIVNNIKAPSESYANRLVGLVTSHGMSSLLLNESKLQVRLRRSNGQMQRLSHYTII